MKYKNYLEKINNALVKHKTEIDKMIAIRSAELQTHNTELEK